MPYRISQPPQIVNTSNGYMRVPQDKIAMIPMLKKLDKLPKKELPRVLHSLEDMGVEIINPNSNYLQPTSEVFNKLYKNGKKFKLKVKFNDKEFDVNNPLLGDPRYTNSAKGGGAYYADKRQLDILTDKNPNLYKFRLAHEIGHTMGLGADLESEHKADAFADKLYPGTTYFYKNNPYIKNSWQKDYTPPNPLPKFIPPEY